MSGPQVHFYHAQFPFDDGAIAQEILETDNAAGWTLQNNTVLRRYVRLPDSVDEAFLMIDYTLNASCTVANDQACEVYVHQNRLGSVIATTNNNGAVVDKFTYSPFGVTGTTNTGFPFRFTGQRLDEETGLYYYKARYYDPETGRFLQVDPIGYADQQNLYAYVGNDPVNYTDPSGLCGERENRYRDCLISVELPDDDERPLTQVERNRIKMARKKIRKIGEEIAKRGTDEEKAAYERVTEVVIRPREDEPTQDGAASAPGVNNPNSIGPIIIWRKGLEQAENDYFYELFIHEIYHFTDKNALNWKISSVTVAGRYQKDCVENDVKREAKAAVRRLGFPSVLTGSIDNSCS